MIDKIEEIIDLSKIKAGDSVKVDCDGEIEVKSINSCGDYLYHITFMKDGECHKVSYHQGGHPYGGGTSYHPFRIVEIIPAAFNWDDVKPGMAFDVANTDDITRCWYIANYFKSEGMIIASIRKDINRQALYFLFKADLTRSPEHDIEVKQ